ncbi:unnamed protein product [Diamesa hyperborea]
MKCLLLLLCVSIISANDGLTCNKTNIIRPNHCDIDNQTVLPTDRFGSSELTELFIFQCDMPVVPEKIFVYSPKLVFLSIHESGTIKITKSLFANAVQLQKVHIQYNNISKLSNNTFISCKSLENLELNGNGHLQVEPAAFYGLSRLLVLSLANNLIESFPPTMLHQLVKLQMFHAFKNKLKFIDDNFFKKNLQLKYLDLSNNQLTTIPGNLFNGLELMNSLYLQYNNLISVANIDFFFLDLSNNNLTSFFIGSKVKSLHLQNNFIESFECSKDLNVANLEADNNSLSNFNCITDMVNLTSLSVSSNKMKKPTPNQFKKLINLRSIMMTDSKNSVVWKASAFKGLNNLYMLRINKLFSYKFVKKILPDLSLLGLKTSKWNCELLERITKTLNNQGVKLMNIYSSEPKVCNVI